MKSNNTNHNHEKFQLLEYYYNVGKGQKQSIISEDRKENSSHKEIVKECCCNNINTDTNANRLTIRQFTKKYIKIPTTPFDIKQSSNKAHFGKISRIKSNLDKFDNKDI